MTTAVNAADLVSVDQYIKNILFGTEEAPRGIRALQRKHEKQAGKGVRKSAIQDSPAQELHQLIVRGLPAGALDRVKEKLGLSDEDIAKALGISRKTLQRRRKEDKPLTAVEGDRIFRFARIFALAKRIFDSEDAANRWLHRGQVGLGGDVPFDLLQTEAGAIEVEKYLGRIAHGVLS